MLDRLRDRLDRQRASRPVGIARRSRGEREQFDEEKFGAIEARHTEANTRNGPRKYLELRRWMRRHLIHARAIGLLDSEPQRVLDLGTGSGYFRYVCGQLGHTAKALDLDDIAVYNELVQFLGVDRKPHRIVSGVPLPDLGMRFDWVTAFSIKFDLNNRPDRWQRPEWSAFLRDLAENQLDEGGQFFLKLNPGRNGRLYPGRVSRLFESLGAEVHFPFVHFRDREKLLEL